MKGQIFELMFYPFFAIMILQLFTFSAGELVSQIKATKAVLEQSSQAIENSNEVLLNRSIDHFGVNHSPGAGSYFIKRLVTNGTAVKELIFVGGD